MPRPGRRPDCRRLTNRCRWRSGQSPLAAEHPEGPRFTSPRTAAGREQYAIDAFADGTGFWLDYDVPLNGAFSDLTAQFEFYWRARHALAARLHDLHVM